MALSTVSSSRLPSTVCSRDDLYTAFSVVYWNYVSWACEYSVFIAVHHLFWLLLVEVHTAYTLHRNCLWYRTHGHTHTRARPPLECFTWNEALLLALDIHTNNNKIMIRAESIPQRWSICIPKTKCDEAHFACMCVWNGCHSRLPESMLWHFSIKYFLRKRAICVNAQQ